MDTQQERLLQLDRDLKSGKNICSSGGVLSCFPSSLKEPFLMQGLGLVVCQQGSFQFSLDHKCASAKAGDTLFIHEESWFQVLQETKDVKILILVYQIEPIRDIIGNSVVSMYMYSKLTPELSCVWNTGEEEEIMKYMSLIDSVLQMDESAFSLYEQKLLLLALTYRICSEARIQVYAYCIHVVICSYAIQTLIIFVNIIGSSTYSAYDNGIRIDRFYSFISSF